MLALISGCTHALPNGYTAAQPVGATLGQARESHSFVCASLPCRACEERRDHTMAWSAVECRVLVCRLTHAGDHVLRCRGTTCAVMSWCLVLDIVPPSTSVHVANHNMPLRPELSRHSTNIFRPRPVHLPIAETETSPSRIATS